MTIYDKVENMLNFKTLSNKDKVWLLSSVFRFHPQFHSLYLKKIIDVITDKDTHGNKTFKIITSKANTSGRYEHILNWKKSLEYRRATWN